MEGRRLVRYFVVKNISARTAISLFSCWDDEKGVFKSWNDYYKDNKSISFKCQQVCRCISSLEVNFILNITWYSSIKNHCFVWVTYPFAQPNSLRILHHAQRVLILHLIHCLQMESPINKHMTVWYHASLGEASALNKDL